jgi:hypothetical protein
MVNGKEEESSAKAKRLHLWLSDNASALLLSPSPKRYPAAFKAILILRAMGQVGGHGPVLSSMLLPFFPNAERFIPERQSLLFFRYHCDCSSLAAELFSTRKLGGHRKYGSLARL